jgi:hypothetical protein
MKFCVWKWRKILWQVCELGFVFFSVLNDCRVKITDWLLVMCKLYGRFIQLVRHGVVLSIAVSLLTTTVIHNN